LYVSQLTLCGCLDEVDVFKGVQNEDSVGIDISLGSIGSTLKGNFTAMLTDEGTK